MSSSVLVLNAYYTLKNPVFPGISAVKKIPVPGTLMSDLEKSRASIDRWIVEYNLDRLNYGVGAHSPHEAFSPFQPY
jgi:hypothetical protein